MISLQALGIPAAPGALTSTFELTGWRSLIERPVQ